MDAVKQFLTDTKFLDIAVWRYTVLLGAVFVGLVAGRIAWYVLEVLSKRLKEDEERQLLSIVLDSLAKPASLFIFFLSLRFGLLYLIVGRTETDPVVKAIGTANNVLFAVAVAYTVYRLVDLVDYYLSHWAAGTDSKIDDMIAPLVRKSLRITVVIVGVLFIIQNISTASLASVVTGLGVGGLAVALAAQDSLKNLFGSLIILFDKPFRVGDRVVLGGHDGPVEEVGFRSTKIRTLEGHVVTVPNDQVANTMVQNIGRRPYIRRLSNITITYDTPPDKVERAVEILKDILENHEGMDPEFPPRIYFNDFNDASLNIIMIYWYQPPAYWDFLAFNEKVNMQILQRFNAEGIDFAFPTQTIYVANDEKRQLALRLLDSETSIGTARRSN